MNKRILLLVPPGKRYYMRDYYCSKISKASYYYHPIDFVILSGILAEGFEVRVLDCIAEKVSIRKAYEKIGSLKPSTVIFLTGAVSWHEDLLFLKGVKEMTGALMIGSGDIFLSNPERSLQQYHFIDALLYDFTTNDVVKFIKDRDSSYQNIVYRDEGAIIARPESHPCGSFSIPLPRHELFNRGEYVFPFTKQKKFATVLTDFGCMFKCSYCAVNRFGFKEREVSEVIQELSALNRIGIKEVVFKDQTFAAHRKRGECLCAEILNYNIKIQWTCFSRPDMIDESLLLSMKKAGCHTIIFGIETCNQELLSAYNRSVPLETTIKAFSLCRSIGIQSVGTFIIGLPGDSRKSVKKTIAFAKSVGCDYASFNIFTPAFGSAARNKLIQDDVISDTISFMDSGISYPTVDTDYLSAHDIWDLRREAVCSFYLNPLYILDKIRCCRGIFSCQNMLRQSYGVIKSLFNS